MTQKIKRQSDAAIFQFIRDLPGGNVPQYAKLLNTTAIRINGLLTDNPDGRRLARAGMVKAAEKGQMPAWAGKRTERGSLRARDVDRMRRENSLPPFVTKLLTSVHDRFKDDALNFLREALEQTSNHTSFEAQITAYMEQDHHRTEQLTSSESRVQQLENEVARFDRVLARANSMAALIEDRSAGGIIKTQIGSGKSEMEPA